MNNSDNIKNRSVQKRESGLNAKCSLAEPDQTAATPPSLLPLAWSQCHTYSAKGTPFPRRELLSPDPNNDVRWQKIKSVLQPYPLLTLQRFILS